jgi:hypothetical protein
MGFSIGAWGLLLPVPYRLAVLGNMGAFVVALAMKVISRQQLAITDAKAGDSRPRIQGLFVMPALVVALRALVDINLLDWQSVLLWALGLAAVLAIPVFANDRQLSKKLFNVIFLPLVTYAFAWGAIAEADFMFDTSPPHVFQTTIRSMHVSHGKSISYHFELASWDGRPAGDSLRVPYALYAGHRPGDQICVVLHDGWLGFRTFEAQPCW